jgi:hypothetical protein
VIGCRGSVALHPFNRVALCAGEFIRETDISRACIAMKS